MPSDRRQINFRTTDDVVQAIEDIRRMSSPIPPVSEVIRSAVLDYRERLARKIDSQKARK